MSDQPGSPNPEHAFDPAKQDALMDAIKQLSPDEAAFFLGKLELSVKKRKITNCRSVALCTINC